MTQLGRYTPILSLDRLILASDIIFEDCRNMSKFIKILFFVFIFTFSTIRFAHASVIFQDSFQGGIKSANWQLADYPNSGLYFASSPFGIVDISTTGYYTFLDTKNISYVNNNDSTIDVKVSNNNVSAFNVFCRKGANFIFGAQFYPAGNGNTLNTFGGVDSVPYNWDNTNGIHHFDIKCQGYNLIVKEDNKTVYQDNNHLYITPTGNTLEFIFGDGHSSEFANFKLCDENGCDPQLQVPLLKQTNPSWKTHEYDTAHLWSPTDQSIGSWGCALTSATMVLQYYGVNKLPDGTALNPDSLNTWLKNHHGYDDGVNSGYLLPQAISQLSYLAKNINNITAFDGLEAQIIQTSDINQVRTDLQNNQPDILGVNNDSHYVVATGASDNTLAINDPYYPRTTLADGYNNTFHDITHYSPSHTDVYCYYCTTRLGIKSY